MTVLSMADRFRGFLPVVVDLETSGVDPERNGILEVGAVFLNYQQELAIDGDWHRAVAPHPETAIDPSSLQITGIDLNNRDSEPVSEQDALQGLFTKVRHAMKAADCTRAVLVAHNASFDHQFIDRAARRNGLKRNPFHPFTAIDTASLAAVAYGHTVLREVCARAGIAFDSERAHGALYDAQVTAELFCRIVNGWGALAPVPGRAGDA